MRSVADPQPERGDTLLLLHCGLVEDERPPAYARLEDAVGDELARFLLYELTGAYGRRGSSSP
jgi:hypothetical protein